jgi:uncharacterized protein YjbI with pentapeptide repeats
MKTRVIRSDFMEADLRLASLSGANLTEANLRGTNFSRADLREADFGGANLSRANLSGADLSEANLGRADLSKANLTNTTLRETNFGAADLRDAKGLEKCNFAGACIIDHRAIERSRTLPRTFLRGCGWPDRVIDCLPALLNDAIQFFSCSISYGHHDKPFAKRLFDTLQGRGVRCWLDEKLSVPGDDVYEQIDRSIRIWDKVLLCCSKYSLSSWWVDNEIDRTFQKERKLKKDLSRKTLALVPLDLDGYLLSGEWQSDKARKVLSRMVVDFRGWDGKHETFESGVDKVILAVRADDGGRPQVPKPKL